MSIFNWFAQASYTLLDFIGLELITSLFFRIGEGGGIKLSLDFGMSKFRKTITYVIVIICLYLAYSTISNLVQEWLVKYLESLGWRVIIAFLTLLSFATLWLTKVLLGRRWSFPLVIYSIIGTLIGLISLLLTE